jgi:amidase/aspartyl-tRNA(Asn)/glutamyl-tRNA(Gln) amidotransferase subunit A
MNWPTDAKTATPLDDATDLCRMDVSALLDGYKQRKISPVEVARATLARAESVQARCNAFTLIDTGPALQAAAGSEARWRAGTPMGALDGVPTTIKDIVYVKDWAAHFGSRAPAIMASDDSPAVALLRQAGAVLIGQTTTPEFGWKAITDSPFSGITRNPWNLDKTPGGSSGGAAVAAATGAGALHLGSDGGGSIRIPASFTGITGHKPTFGRVPAYPASAFGTVAHIGPMTRSVADAALMLDVMSGRDFRDWHQNVLPFTGAAGQRIESLKGLRIGVWQTPPQGKVAEDVAAAFETMLGLLARAGAVLETVALPGENLLELFHTLWFSGAAARLQALPHSARAEIDPGLLQAAEAGARISATELIAANTKRAGFGAAFDTLLAQYAFIVSPAVAVTAFTAGEEVPTGSGLSRWTEWAGFSFPVNLAQAPATVIPCALSPDGLPIGLQVIGPRGADGAVLAAAAACAALLALE